MQDDDTRPTGRPRSRGIRALFRTARRRPRRLHVACLVVLVCALGAAVNFVFLGASGSPDAAPALPSTRASAAYDAVLRYVESTAPRVSRALASTRASEAYNAMRQYFYSTSTGSYTSTEPATQQARAWPFSQALWATASLAALPVIGSEARANLRAQLSTLARYRVARRDGAIAYSARYGGNGYVYYDDNLWIALGLVETSDVLADPRLVATAGGLFALVASQWDTNPSDPCPGGVFWTNDSSNHDRNAVTTANAAVLALELYQRTHSPSYLAFAKKAYAWTARCLRLPNGLIQDHIDLQGRVDPTTWSYNQGAMIAAGVDLFRATGKRSYLLQAEQTGVAELKYLSDPLTADDSPIFLAIFYRDLAKLAQVDPDAQIRAASDAFADEAWSAARDPKTGLFTFGGAAPSLLDQAAMVQIYAQVASA